MTTPRLSSPAGGRRHALGRAQAEDRVVVDRVVDERAVVDRLVAVLGQPGEQVGLEVEPGVVGAEVDAHGGILSVASSDGHEERQRSAGSAARPPGTPRVPPEAVHLAQVAGRGHVDPARRGAAARLLALVAQGVVLRGDDQGRRQGGERVREQRREVGVREVLRAAGVLLPVPLRLARVEADGGAERVGVEARRAGRGTGRSAPLRAKRPGCAERRDQREVAARAVAVDVRRPARGRAPAHRGRARPAPCRRRRERPGSGARAAAGSPRSAPPCRAGSRAVGRAGRAPRRRGRRSRRRAGGPPVRVRAGGAEEPTRTPSASRSTTSATSSGSSWSAAARLASRAATTS